MCLDFPDRPRHVRACRTSLLPDNSWRESIEKRDNEFMPCPNHFRIKETFEREKEDLQYIFATSTEDNEASPSCEDQQFLQIMKAGVHKNIHGNWEMLLLGVERSQKFWKHVRCHA